MTTGRKHKGDAVAERWTSGGCEREAAAETDPHQTDATIRCKFGLRTEPGSRLLDRVAHRGAYRELLQIGNVRSDNGEAARGQLTRKGDKPRLVNTRRMKVRDQ